MVTGALAAKNINNKLGDEVGLTTLVSDGTGYVKYLVRNGFIHIIILGGNAGGNGTFKLTKGSYKQIATIPSKYVPTNEVFTPLGWQSGETTGVIARLSTAGALSVYTAGSQNAYYVGSITYPYKK